MFALVGCFTNSLGYSLKRSLSLAACSFPEQHRLMIHLKVGYSGKVHISPDWNVLVCGQSEGLVLGLPQVRHATPLRKDCLRDAACFRCPKTQAGAYSLGCW